MRGGVKTAHDSVVVTPSMVTTYNITWCSWIRAS